MSGRRPRLFAFLGATLALMPAAAIGGGVDVAVTSALPVAPLAYQGRPDAPTSPFADVAILKGGLDRLAANDVAGARPVREVLPANSLDRHILAWAIALYGGDRVPSGDIADAAQMLPNWPGTIALRKNSERALYRENPSPQVVVKAFKGSQPLTPEGVIILARSYVALGNLNAARSVLSPFWRTERLEARDEATIIKEFGALIPAADHRFRMERMFYADRVSSALRVAALAGAEPLAEAWAAAGRGDRNTAKLLNAVPAAQRSAGYFFAEAEYLRKQQKFADAAAIVMKAPTDRESLVDPDAWWVERRVLSRELVDQGDMKTAYKIVSMHAAESPASAAEAEFHAGWYALRGLNDPATAAAHFTRIADLAQGPMSLSRAYYWLGRTAEVGGPGDAKTYFTRAAAYGTTFYGQLAGERVGLRTLNIAYPQPSAADRQNFAGREAVSAIKRLQEAGYDRYAETLYRDLAGQLTSPGELALLAVLAEKQGNHFMALKVGKIAAQRGIDVGALSHPLGVIPDTADISGSGKALAYAIARQESEFNIGAVSSAGARGLLQLMPGTARQLAKKAGLTFSQTRLTSDAGYNATLGAAFLGEQLDRFSGSYVLTFAGYNAGPNRAAQWVAKYGDPRGKDVDAVVDWIERIPYTETRSYVQRVMENYEVYKMRISGKYDIVGDLVNGRS
ncbi:lytic transglycosylase domain-containing protein [Mesorhizobium sp. M4B.F.Ca.ET.215.01.1.1]|uniref:lytic transglycosylase domain-containing protein n=1 Tax=unclassified Mesorhizobium TaxID=325217 RepID=UPI000FD36C65|nr:MULTISPECIES: lytic transglycosylase domain-containing protein [unclassified Mesorhizobium]RUW25090.1 lytic transglycosylase domain-containing protein [Mesorhizobium sp. M4B.F.Ca.ET.013.02.1.1]RWF66244.1 MAG: lytic transglycosylase domain-containing protein [Mesorhizobium sp.]TGQ13205.1 lytic transglycosylase domain-containing protein [Mesorhizobium sp. M4B.F.Ca.ET.215.01.1.1]TGQ43517.1 lytic transglycosylase domain-containing protein [Mesorhizobium sp. M4B.F.Ca.ET.214.01.1.1]TGQ46177.1 lyt